MSDWEAEEWRNPSGARRQSGGKSSDVRQDRPAWKKTQVSNPRKSKKPGRLTALNQILPSVGEALGLDDKVQEMAVMSVWSQVVDGRYRNQTRPMKLVKRGQDWILWVAVENGGLATDLSFQLESLKERMNQYAPQTGLSIAQIQLKIAPV